jgi:putative resolvase
VYFPPGERRVCGYWLRQDLDRYLRRTVVERPRRTVCYGRVSCQAQRPDLKNQRRIVEEFVMAKGMANLDLSRKLATA